MGSISVSAAKRRLLQRHLELVLVAGDLALRLDVAALGAGSDGVGKVLPHHRRHRPGLVGQRDRKELTTLALFANLKRGEDKVGGDDGVIEAGSIRDKKIFH